MATKVGHGKDGAEKGEVLIIGAGPAGLCLAAHLRHCRIPFRILEKGNTGDSWRRMPPGLKLVSPWKTDWLSPTDARRHAANAQLTRDQYLEYLHDFAVANQLDVETNCEVLTVSPSENGFQVDTADEQIVCRFLVSATGYFSNPFRPPIPGADGTAIPQLHYADYRGPEQVRALADSDAIVLIVGKRLSAGQTMLELSDAGFRVALSHQTPIQFGCSDWLWPLAYRSFARVEAIKLKLFGDRSARLDVRMPGGRGKHLIAAGVARTFPGLARFHEHFIAFQDGRELRPGLVLYATGFRPALKHLAPLNLACCPETGAPLCDEMESVSTPGLFFLGLDMLRNFQSRFLRGIRHDAEVLAQKIQTRLAARPAGRAELSAA
jgi:putative flavoprotein involved in K+ transport